MVIRIFDEDDDSLDDIVGEVSFVPSELMFSEPIRHPLYGGICKSICCCLGESSGFFAKRLVVPKSSLYLHPCF